ncbi:hypothetical protein [Nocardia brevicatena]|uniref:hypothetical protein n=1 Tax=Nocardia brevicatena TaxID=37327 RepID=UPI000300BA44|nr:hypothetical protein [Nocardia brevicatena]
MNGSDGSEIIAKMLQAAQRLVDALAKKGATRVSESHHELPQGVRDGLDRTIHGAEQAVAELDRLDPAGHVNRDTDATQSATEGRSPDSSIEEHTRRGGRDRSEISAEEARELYEQVRDREPDFAGTGNRVSLVDTSAGPAVIRFGLERPIGTLLKKWMPENAAINYARECGVRTPKILHAGTDPSTGREFTIMQYVPGETCKFDDPEVMNWLPDLLDQVQLTSSAPYRRE